MSKQISKLMKKEHIILAFILILAFLLRFYGVVVDVYPDFREATYGMAAWRIVEGEIPYRDFYHSQPPISPFLLAFVFLLFGVGIVQGRLFLAFFTTFTTLMIFLIGKRIDYKTGLLGSLIFAVASVSIKYGMRLLNDFIAMTFCVIGYYFLTSVITNYNERDFTAERNNLVFAGLFVGVGVLVKTIIVPIFLAFIVILIIEGKFAEVRLLDQAKNVVFLIIGFILPMLFILLPFYLVIGESFIEQVLGQHLAKESVPLTERWIFPLKFLILDNSYFFAFFALSIPFALRKPHGRGLIICVLFMVLTLFLFVPRQYVNYYEVNILWMSISCGFFPFPSYKSLNSKLVTVNFIIVANLLFYKVYRHFNLHTARMAYFDHYLSQLALICSFIGLAALTVIIIIDRRFNEEASKKQPKNFNFFLNQSFKSLRNIFSRDGIKIIIVISLTFLIATTYFSYFPISEKDKTTIDWIKANTSPDEYILSDDMKINFWAKRRSPFAEISKDRTDLGELTGEMFIEACYDFDVKVIVNTGRMFDYRDTYIVFLEFLEANYAQIELGHTIYVRTISLQ
jgi:4-amino-4-deoxy-L-arabinose transferase-like glycosyltransferase